MPAPAPTIRVMIVHDQGFLREGLKMLILGKPAFELAAEVANTADIIAVAERERPDVITLDLDLATNDAFKILQGLVKNETQQRVLALTRATDPEVHRKALLLGAMGVVEKAKGADVLLKAIAKVSAGEVWYDRSKMGEVLRDILRNGSEKKADPAAMKVATLTPREHEVIALVSKGLKNREIGERLFICETTVRHHLTSVFEKLGVSNRLELIIFAFSQGLATLPENDQYQHNGRGKSLQHSEMTSSMQN